MTNFRQRTVLGPGHQAGIVGLGGLGHMGVKIAAARGAHVVLFTTSDNPCEDALRLAAKEVLVSKNADKMAADTGSFDFILNTVAAPHDLDAFLVRLKLDGTMKQRRLAGADRRHPGNPENAGLLPAD